MNLDHIEKASEMMHILGNEARAKIVAILARGGETSVGGLHALLPQLSQPSLSQHLALLRINGVVATRREARNIYYYLNDVKYLRLITSALVIVEAA